MPSRDLRRTCPAQGLAQHAEVRLCGPRPGERVEPSEADVEKPKVTRPIAGALSRLVELTETAGRTGIRLPQAAMPFPAVEEAWHEAFGDALKLTEWQDLLYDLVSLQLVDYTGGAGHIVWNATPLGVRVANALRANLGSVFLSHSHQDNEVCSRLAFDLERSGFGVFFDLNDVAGGDSIPSKINRALEASRYVVIVHSVRSQLSKWVQREIDSALTMEIDRKLQRVLVIKLDSTPLPPLLAPKRYIELKQGSYTEALSELLIALGKPA
jgi:hypothetical protein